MNRKLAVIGLVGAALTTLSGLAVEVLVKPASDVSDTMWSYPWSSDAIAPVSILYAGFHLLVLFGMLAVVRAMDHKFVQNFFGGDRGRRALQHG